MVDLKKIKIGDRVLIKKDFGNIIPATSLNATTSMINDFAGKIVEITEIIPQGHPSKKPFIRADGIAFDLNWLDYLGTTTKTGDRFMDHYNIHGEIDWYRLQKESIESKKTAFVIVKKTEAYLGYIPIAGALWLGGGEFDVEKTMEFTIYKGDRSKIHEMIQFSKEVQKLHKKAKRESEKMSKCPIPEKYEINRVMTF